MIMNFMEQNRVVSDILASKIIGQLPVYTFREWMAEMIAVLFSEFPQILSIKTLILLHSPIFIALVIQNQD